LRTAQEKIADLHIRMEQRRETKEKRKTAGLGAATCVLALCLAAFVFSRGTSHGGGLAGMYSGATMFFEDAGAFVLVAVAAFMLGVVATLLCLRMKKRSAEEARKNGAPLKSGGGRS